MRPSLKTCLTVATLLTLSAIVSAQTEPTTPAAQTFHDTRYGVSFQIPTAWNLSRKDSDLSTFNLDARTAPRNAQLRAVADIAFNPFPSSTFTGALFYFSITPKTTTTECAQQASAQAPRTVTATQIGGIPFTHGYDQHGGICTESRDEIYTARRNNACYRFDLVINTFCGGDAGAGARDITPRELESIRKRMQAILDSVRFDAK
ncbi:MAG TPA: hypothetical protein VK608_17235 [Edaphobacter sp.]|nr:hypothetical protein [Edaphobacter sp.]